MESAEDEEDLPCTVGGGVEEAGSRHFESVFERGLAAGFLLAEVVEGACVVVWVAAHVGDSDGEAIAHADYAELGDGVLFEEFGDEGAGVAEGEEVAGGPEVFFLHGDGEVED